MTLLEIEQFALATIEDHVEMYPDRLKGLSFAWNNRKRALGVCRFEMNRFLGTQRITIELSRPLMQVATSDDVIIDTILHEIAHALAGISNGHNHIWKMWAVKVGANPTRCASHDEVDTSQLNSKYTLTCPACGKQTAAHRKIKRSKACGKCCDAHGGGYQAQFKLTVTQNY